MGEEEIKTFVIPKTENVDLATVQLFQDRKGRRILAYSSGIDVCLYDIEERRNIVRVKAAHSLLYRLPIDDSASSQHESFIFMGKRGLDIDLAEARAQ